MKKIMAIVLAGLLALSLLPAAAFAQTNVDLAREDGRLLITEPGSYVLTGKLTGCVYIDPHEGVVELVLDGADIDGRNGGIVAVSGDALKLTLPEGSVNRVTDGGGDRQFDAAIYSRVDTVFDGGGALYVTGNGANGIRADKAALTFNGGSYAVKAPACGIGAETLTFNGGHFSIQAENSIDPNAKLAMNGGVIEELSWNGAAVPAYSAAAYTAPQENSGFAQNAANRVGELFNTQQLPEMPNGNFSSQQPPEMQNGNFDSQQPPEMPNGDLNNQQMQQPGQGTGWDSSDSPSEIVSGTLTNSAASLEADYENASYITVTDEESQVKITSSGTYVVSGESADGNITVKKGTTGVVLVLQDLDLTSTTGATLSVNKEAEVKVIISGNVVLTDNENPDDETSEDADVADAFDGAAFKAKANSNVYVTGDGTLTINGNAKNGIKAGDDASLIFDGVTVNISAVNDGINGNYDVTLLSGSFTIAAGDDAIHADHILTIGKPDGSGPTIRVTESEEGLEGTVVNVYGGDISIVLRDDAVNAANGDGLYEGELVYAFNMLDGKLVIQSGGDGIDSNGDINLVGGSAEIHSTYNGGEAGIDYDGQLYIADAFTLNNQSGMAGPDGMGGPGGMGQMNTQPGGMNSQGFGGINTQQGNMGRPGMDRQS